MTTRRPTKRIFSIRKAGSRDRWDEIGVVFQNADGSENLVLNYLPRDPEATLQLRPFEERERHEEPLASDAEAAAH